MQITRQFIRLVWLAPLLLYSADALAWGLFTHAYFAQWLVWTMPLLDPNLRRAVQRFPRLVMAGACLPDLALMSPLFRHTHHWQSSHNMLRIAATDEERAIAVGYASHLFVDVVAHNHFVPAHEAMWLQDSLITHVFGEWAMDAHLAPLLDASPHKLLHEHHTLLAQFAARSFDCPQPMAARALRHLAAADRLLRSVRLPQFLYRALRLFDKGAFHHFIYYVSQTQDCIAQIDSLFAGAQPAMEPELASSSQSLLAQLRDKCMGQLKARHHAPIEFLWTTQNSYNMKDMLAISAPIAAPANTSVG